MRNFGAIAAMGAVLGIAGSGLDRISAPVIGASQERARLRLAEHTASERRRLAAMPPVTISRQVRRWHERRGLPY